jgi:hypothetical protein
MKRLVALFIMLFASAAFAAGNAACDANAQ